LKLSLHFLDLFFIVFHTFLIFFNLFGWIWKPTRKANLVTLLLTGGSWFILGIFYGWGYCPLTDWHWEVLNKIGAPVLPDSYISYLLQRLTGIFLSAKWTDFLTLMFYFLALSGSVYTNLFRRRGK